ncbi:MAG: MMPL family transporter, partial [Mycobacterium sp.]|nr:MMPL family transporter [Mycobacterium sp.]
MVDTAPRPAPPTARRSPGVVWGEFIARHRRVVLGIGLLVVVISAAMYPMLQSRLVGVDFSVPGNDSATSDSLLARHFT